MEAGIWAITVHCCAKGRELRYFQAYRGKSRVWFTRFEQRSNEDESSSVHREPLPSRCGLLKNHQRHVHTSENKVELQKRQGSFERTKLGLQFLHDRRAENIPSRLFKYVHFDTMIDVTVKKRDKRIGMLYFLYRERESVQNLKINWKENSRVRIGRIAFTAEASNL